MGAARGSARYALLATFVGLLTVAAAAVSASAHAVSTASPSLAGTQAQAQQVVGQIDALNVSLDKSDELMNLANLKLANVRRGIAMNRRELVVAQRNLTKSRRSIARRLVEMYTAGSTSSLEVILGGNSLGEILNRIDTAHRVSTVETQVAGQIETFHHDVLQNRQRLSVERGQVTRLVALRSSQLRAIQSSLAERRQLLSSLNGEVAKLVAEQQARELIAARSAQQQAAEGTTQATRSYADAAVGATAQTPEGAAVVPPSSYTGVVGAAMGEIGTPYVWAGDSPSGFDCSGLVMYAYQQVGVSLPHSSYAMWNVGTPVTRDQLEPGDIVFFDGEGHVGIYIGGGEFVHAPHTGTTVQVSSLDSGSYAGSFDGARRI